jgi:hypothetical protein
MLALAGAARRWEPKRLRLPVLGRRPPGQQRPSAAAPAGRALALGHRDHRRGHPHSGPSVWLTSRNNPGSKEGETTRPVEPRPPGATAGQPAAAAR